MGIYFNPGNDGFRATAGSRIYVDKTGLLEFTNHVLCSEENCISLSHARRFGKSQAARMLEAYYSCGCDSRALFTPLTISGEEDFLTHLNAYNVIHVDVSSFADRYKEKLVEHIWPVLYEEMQNVLPGLKDIAYPIGAVLQDACNRTGKKFVIILDEWDCVIRNFADDQKLVHQYLQFLHALFKSEEAKSFLALAYITGILPLKKVKDESALNNFFEYTMKDSGELTAYFGFTEAEVRILCERYQMEFDSVREWYDGYRISGLHMYNPNSVYQAMIRGRIDSYWKNTSAFETINQFITMNFDGLKESILKILQGQKVSVNTDTFQNDLSIIRSKDEALTALIHLGYLGYDAECKKAYMPNYEVSMAFRAALTSGSWQEIARTISRCEELLWATIDGEEDTVANLVELAHETYCSVLKYNDENSLSCALTMAYFTAPAYYNVVRELPTGKGFADIVFIPRADSGQLPAMVIELKWKKDADSAIQQIREKRYAGNLKGYGREILLVGISYDKNESKKHSCRIERIRIE